MAEKGEAGQSKSPRGFAVMERDKQREIASKGGKAAHQKGTAHEFDSQQAKEAGRKGGMAVSRSREHMAEIGRKGGQSVSANRDHMSQIGRKGGEAVSQNREHMSQIGRKGGESVSSNREHMSEIGREGGSARGRGDGNGSHRTSAEDQSGEPEHPGTARQPHKSE